MSKRIKKAIDLPKFELPIVIPVFNNLTYLSNTINFFKSKGFNEYLILNNGSQYNTLEEYFSGLSEDVTILDLPDNPGPRVYFENQNLYRKLPEKFILTDPDLGFKKELDKESVLHLFDLCDQHRLYKIGSALTLDIDEPNCLDMQFISQRGSSTIRQGEIGYYRSFCGITKYGDTIYNAPIDTTFAVYNKRYFAGNVQLANCRVAGRYSAIHYGWYDVPPIPKKEYEFYKKIIEKSQFASTEWVKSGKVYTI
jgi:glycosyltransferase involved in cell wall biosynthesis